MTGLFINQSRSHRGPSRGYIARKKAQGARTLQKFAEALANGAPTVAAAAREAGVSQQRGYQMFQKICAELGPQAR